MKKKMCQMFDSIKVVLETKDYTVREAVMAGLLLFLTGIVLGAVFTPKKQTIIGSNNGNNSGTITSSEDEWDEDEE